MNSAQTIGHWIYLVLLVGSLLGTVPGVVFGYMIGHAEVCHYAPRKIADWESVK